MIFLDGEKIANGGVFDGYNWVVWTTIIVQAIGGIAAPFFAGPAFADARNVASATTIILTSLGSVWLFEFEPTMTVRSLLCGKVFVPDYANLTVVSLRYLCGPCGYLPL